MIKPSKVVFISQELEDCFESMRDDDPIKRGILRAVAELSSNTFAGIQIPKRIIPKTYIVNYGVNNFGSMILPMDGD